LDIAIFTLLRSQAIEVFGLLLAVREFATAKGLQTDVDRLNNCIAESEQMLSLANTQLSELEQTGTTYRVGFFDTVNTL
jgi:hypothetical protein